MFRIKFIIIKKKENEQQQQEKRFNISKKSFLFIRTNVLSRFLKSITKGNFIDLKQKQN